MKTRRWIQPLGALVLALTGLAPLIVYTSADHAGAVSGVVVTADRPVAGARVRVRATDNLTYTSEDGRFTLTSLTEGEEIEVTAWANGYYIASTHVTPTVSAVTLTLRPYHIVDNADYEWTSPIAGTSEGACGNCHPMIVTQWITNAHGGAVSNLRFFSLYNGTNVAGTAQVGPGYLNDFPNTAGNCANCHAPGAGVDGYLTTNVNNVRDTITAGVHCDYCHKIGGVYLDPATQSVYHNAPGVRSQRVLRPPEGDNIFFGPYDDIHDPDTYLPAIGESQFCAPCHQFSFWGTPVYESYEEWLASPYAERGRTCQDCHMPPTGDSFFALPEAGGLEHPPDRIPSHLQLGATSQELLQNTVTLSVAAEHRAETIQVTVTITNTQAGHHVPTDHPGRHMILVVTATDSRGRTLAQVSGPEVPAWGGAQAGMPGKAFAKVLRDVESDEAPAVSYWKQAVIESDNRIPALATDSSTYTFAALSDSVDVEVTAHLVFRRLFAPVAEQKGWEVTDIVMEDAIYQVPAPSSMTIYLPLMKVDCFGR